MILCHFIIKYTNPGVKVWGDLAAAGELAES